MSDWVVRLIEESRYLGVGFLMFLETLFPPIPSEVIMPIAGMSVARGQMSFAGVVASGTAGAMLGNLVWYLAARALGVDRMRPWIARHGRWLTISWTDVQRAERWTGEHGGPFVFLGRLIPTVRSLVSVPAGLLRMRFRTFFIASTLGTAAWTALLAGAGYELKTNVAGVSDAIGPVSNAVLLLLLGIYAWRLLTHEGQAE